MHSISRLALAITALALLTSAAFADDWVATKLRGGVFVYVDGGWVQLKRGDTVPEMGVIRTKPGARATFERGAETVAIGPDTQIQMNDKNGGAYTTVKQWYGDVAVEAEARNVEHFEVRTPQMAAVVKGTKFTVDADGTSTTVAVQRGHVAVEDQQTHYQTTISVGQSASAGEGQVLTVEGKGSTPPVVNATGEVVVPPAGPQPASNAAEGENVGESSGGSGGIPGSGTPSGSDSGSSSTSLETTTTSMTSGSDAGSTTSAPPPESEKDKKDKEEKEKKDKEEKEKKDKDDKDKGKD